MPTTTTNCKNCEQPLSKDALYCAYCGQKNTDGRTTVRSLFAEFFDAVFNIESRTLRTLRTLFIPGKLTDEYFEGRQRMYVHPIRTLLVMSIFLILTLGYLDFDKVTNHPYVIWDEMQRQNQRELVMDSLVMAQRQTSAVFQDETVDLALDSLHYFLRQRIGWHGDSFNLRKYMTLFGDDRVEMISRADFLKLSPKELAKKYEPEGWFNQQTFQQTAKYIQDESVLSSYLVGSMSWIALLIMPVIALMIQLFYRKQKRFYVEHLIFSFHLHSFFFLVLSLGLLVAYASGISLLMPIVGISAIYFLFALKRVYQEGWGKTIIKWLFMGLSYMILLLAIFISVTVSSFLIF
ncbi:MAG: DUF3667 domain-containing protein [Saprospiraceae bacterium]|nr:DUF3667 domain-containing protein [Saprospiraceae bacterium]